MPRSFRLPEKFRHFLENLQGISEEVSPYYEVGSQPPPVSRPSVMAPATTGSVANSYTGYTHNPFNWSPVPVLGVDTRLLGGPNGPANLQAQALVDRTEAIKHVLGQLPYDLNIICTSPKQSPVLTDPLAYTSAPRDFTVQVCRATLRIPSSAGTVKVQVKIEGALLTELQLPPGIRTAEVFVSRKILSNSDITVNVTSLGLGAAGLNVTLSGTASVAIAEPKYVDMTTVVSAPAPAPVAQAPDNSNVFPLVYKRRLMASDSNDFDLFGNAVAISRDGSVAVVGSVLDDTQAGGDSGSVYVFVRNSVTGSWVETQHIVPPVTISTNFRFGASVAVTEYGNKIVVGAPGATINGKPGAGGVYTYAKQGDTWFLEQAIYADDLAAGDGFGSAIDIAETGRHLVIGAPYCETRVNQNSGAAYVYYWTGAAWLNRGKLITLAEETTDDGIFGSSVSISNDGERIAIGAMESSVQGAWKGAAFVFKENTDGSYSQTARIQSPSITTTSRFGADIDISGDGNIIVIGSTFDTNNGATAGSVWTFVRHGETWNMESRLFLNQGSDLDLFGAFVWLTEDGSKLAIAAPQRSVSNRAYAGAVYIYKRENGAWVLQAELTSPEPSTNEKFGFGVSMSAYGGRLIVGAPNGDGPTFQWDPGCVYIFEDQ